MKELSVCCVMLVNGRPEMVVRAIQSFRKQAHPNKYLMIWDTSPEPLIITPLFDSIHHAHAKSADTVGELRNEANRCAVKYKSTDLIAHWDSDDWSHPSRLMEQVALLEMTGKECVGYNDMLFWETSLAQSPASGPLAAHFGLERATAITNAAGKAWLWNNLDKRHPIGTSLMYKRSAWERVPFLALPNKAGATGEEYSWLKQVDALGVSSLPEFHGEKEKRPRMIASIHGANTQHYDPAEYVAYNRGTSWKRAAEWDAHCREVMAL